MRPKGLPPDTQPCQRVLDWLIKHAPSACSPKVASRALRMPEGDVTTVLVGLAENGFAVRETSCYRAALDEDGVL